LIYYFYYYFKIYDTAVIMTWCWISLYLWLSRWIMDRRLE